MFIRNTFVETVTWWHLRPDNMYTEEWEDRIKVWRSHIGEHIGTQSPLNCRITSIPLSCYIIRCLQIIALPNFPKESKHFHLPLFRALMRRFQSQHSKQFEFWMTVPESLTLKINGRNKVQYTLSIRNKTVIYDIWKLLTIQYYFHIVYLASYLNNLWIYILH